MIYVYNKIKINIYNSGNKLNSFEYLENPLIKTASIF